MPGKALTRADIATALHQRVGLSFRESADVVDFVIDEICDAVVRGEYVKIATFGSFRLRDKKARVGRNLKTLEEVTISERRVLLFRPSQHLRRRVASGSADDSSGDR